MQPNDFIKDLQLAEPSLKQLSFCSSNKVSRLQEWAGLLRPTQLAVTSGLLYRAIPEINQLITTPDVRFSMLETIRPYAHNIISSLSKSFLHQPLCLGAEAQQSAVIAQALQKHMLDGYLLCIREELNSKKGKNWPGTHFVIAIHRAITAISLLFMRTYQIYTHPTKDLWLQLHALFRLADAHELLDERVADETQRLIKITSIQVAYLRTAVMATARPHQLSQTDVAKLFDVLGEWANDIKFTTTLSDNKDNFFYIDLDKDSGPLYKSRIEDDDKENLLIELNFKPLLSQLIKYSEGNKPEEDDDGADQHQIDIVKEIGPGLLKHVLNTWSSIAQRKQDRRETQTTVDLAVGLSDCHYFLSHGKKFEDFVSSVTTASSIDKQTQSGFTPRDTFSSSSNDYDRPINRVEVQNISQGGYCLLWHSSTPMRVEAGDLLAIREFSKKIWTVGVVRWIRQKRNSSQLGVQIISDKAEPVAIAQVYDMGGYSDYMRGLLLPQSQYSQDPPSIICPCAPFQEYDKVKIVSPGRSDTIKLDKRIFATSTIQQFIHHSLGAKSKDIDDIDDDTW